MRGYHSAQPYVPTPAGRLSFGIFAALAGFESDLIRERTIEGQHFRIFGSIPLPLCRRTHLVPLSWTGVKYPNVREQGRSSAPPTAHVATNCKGLAD